MIVLDVVLAAICLLCLLRLRSMAIEIVRLRRSDRMKSTFLKHLSREIRTPLHSVCGLAEVIAKEDLYLSKDEKQTISNQIVHNAGLISTLLDETLVLAFGSNGRHLDEESVSPNAICRRCVDTFVGIMAANPSVRVMFRRELSDGFFVQTDPRALELVVNRLLALSCKFTKEGEIVVGCSTTERAGKLVIYVQDTGQGIPDSRRRHLYDWFERPDEHRDECELELSIAQKMVMKLGGFVHADSQYHGGTRMEIVLPVR